MKTYRVMRMIRSLSATRLATLALGAGLVGMGLDAGVAHFAGREMKNALQLVPVIAAPIGFIALAVFAVKRWPEKTLRTALRIAGALIALVGVIGTAMHGRTFMMLMEGTAWTFADIEVALRVAPPLAAPGAFIAIGGLLALLASPRISLRIIPRKETGAFDAGASAGSAAAA
jgi:hypothetical protein